MISAANVITISMAIAMTVATATTINVACNILKTDLNQDIDGAVPKIRNGTFHFPSGRRTNPLTPDYPPLEKPKVR